MTAPVRQHNRPTICATCRVGHATRTARLAILPEEEPAIRALTAAFPGVGQIPNRWPICGACIRQARRVGVWLQLRPLPPEGS